MSVELGPWLSVISEGVVGAVGAPLGPQQAAHSELDTRHKSGHGPAPDIPKPKLPPKISIEN